MEYSRSIQNRMKRLEGQLRGVMRLMEEDKECRDVVTQLSAVQGAIDRTIGLIVSENLEQCVRTSIVNGEETNSVVKDAVDLLVKSR
ncbi:metal-sensitive transcriptional regulator [Domibacillus enclensis]|uniref:Cytoplasmic protein n=1 Tax=Domibacillus enclensis TaxID=1017273 RepID=A0A1N6SLP4_9BACI|nr:metal-sensitive transcriptional regulator [Domibacillus enclensis]OXS79363.1 cytoplasmic protein [Domibacillus enclensis]SIQ42001.1 DNA-binding transcriptional regulator, FrmR family [Domibacillus enclensis]